MKLRGYLFTVLLMVLVFSCARRGRPTGGPKDEDKPIMVKAEPDFKSINFKADEIKIYFDEYIKLKDVNSQLIVSPPLKYPLVITPLGTPSKFIKLKIQDTLQENTTYTFNFGQSVLDNTEGNILDNFKYILSTGSYVDSLEIRGYIKHAFDLKLDQKEKPTIMLYAVDEHFNDSIIYKEKPMYVGTILDSVRWNITNIKAGKYLLLAVQDKNKNYKYEPKSDEIGFYPDFVTVPVDTAKIHQIYMFKEILDFDLPSKPKEISKGHIVFGYEGLPNNFEVSPISDLPENYRDIKALDREKDTLHYFFKNFDKDSIFFSRSHINVIDTVKVTLREDELDSLYLDASAMAGVLHLRDTILIKTNNPVASIDTNKIYFINQDSVRVKFHTNISKFKNEINFHFDKAYEQKYRLEFFPGAVTDFFDISNDTLKLSFTTKKPTNYSSLFLTINNVKSYPIIVQLINNKGDVKASFYAENPQEYKFENLEPSKYMVRLIYDANKNGRWDTGSFLKRQQAEEVFYFKNILDAKANWELIESFTIQP